MRTGIIISLNPADQARLEAQVPKDKAVHVILDNYATHKHPNVMQWLGRHTRFTFHYTPTSASWLNAVEGFFAKLTKQRLKRGVFHSLVALLAVTLPPEMSPI